MAKNVAKLCKHFWAFPMWGKLFKKFLDPDKKKLGPLKDLDGLIDEVLALDYAKSYLRMQFEIGRTATGDLNKSAALATFQKKSEKSHIFLHHFGNPAPNKD